MANDQRAAILTTLKNGSAVIDSFIRYHLFIGFDHFFLFFDDPTDPAIEKALKYPQVTVFRNDDALKQKWRETRLFSESKRVRDHIELEVMARQELNAEIAIQHAMERKIDWLLHIDIDELFFPRGQSVAEHFNLLSSRNIHHITYLNYEAAPENPDIIDYFKEVTLFKRAPATLDGGWYNSRQKEIIASTHQLAPNFFLFYGNGKSAAKVVDGLASNGVHKFRNTKTKVQREIVKNPFILHYPCCGFEHFWNKYRSRGRFQNKWFGEIDINEPFHLESRDVVMQGDRHAAREFYERRVVIRDEGQIISLTESGLFCRIQEPSKILAKSA
jgi:hypothetical protein